jgi:hypothetical protein
MKHNDAVHPPGDRFSALTAGAKSLMVFKAKSQQIISGYIFGFYQTFIGG